MAQTHLLLAFSLVFVSLTICGVNAYGYAPKVESAAASYPYGSKPSLEKPKPYDNVPKPSLEKPKSYVYVPKPSVEKPTPYVNQQKPTTVKPKPYFNKPKPSFEKPKPYVYVPKPSVVKPKPYVYVPKPSLEKPKSYSDYKPKTSVEKAPKVEETGNSYGYDKRKLEFVSSYGQQPKPSLENSKSYVNYQPKPSLEKPKPYFNQPKPSLEKPKPDFNQPKPSLEKPKPYVYVPKPTLVKPKPYVYVPKPTLVKPTPYVYVPKPSLEKPKTFSNKPKTSVEKAPKVETGSYGYDKRKLEDVSPYGQQTNPNLANPKAPYVNVPKPSLEKATPLVYVVPKPKPYVPYTTLGVQGIISCKSGPKFTPLTGAVARVTCLAVDEYGYKSAPLTILSAPTDINGYFLATLPSKVNGNLKVTNCKVFLNYSPSETCNIIPTNFYKGTSVPDVPGLCKLVPYKKMKLCSVGTIAYSSKSKPINGGY